jgi:hypothetical protein
MKKPWLAFLLNILFPGAGMVYLNKWGWAVLNLVGVILGWFLAGVVIGLVDPENASSDIKPVGTLVTLVSASIAMAVAQSMNAKLRTQGGVQQTNPPVQAVPYGMPQVQYAAPSVAPMPPPPYISDAALGQQPGFHNAPYAAHASIPVSNYPVPEAAIPQPAGASSPLPIPGRSKFCGECGAPVGNTKFCPECGKPLRSKDECSQCGTKFQAGTKFCGECGTKIG